MFADVYVGYPIENSFTYRIPESQNVTAGMRVKVDFGNRKIIAFVYKVHDCEPKTYIPKDILSVIDSSVIFDQRLITLSANIASNYLSAIGEVLSLAIPSSLKYSKRFKIPFTRKTERDIVLTDEQNKIYIDIIKSYGIGGLFHLIFGITGSGKTEIYIELAKYMLSINRSVIYLVPEISLSTQIFERMYNIFGDYLIVYHSHLTKNQRLYNWIRFYSGDVKIVVGTRSAVFLQCPDLGMIIIDEEHDWSYKEHSSPRYNAKKVAFFRSEIENSLIVMGSATPSIETFYTSEKGIIKRHNLGKRFGGALLPEVEITKINSKKSADMLSSILKLYTKRAVDSGKQAIYLLNRRGFSPIVICNNCSSVVLCPHCSISMNFHRDKNMLCHYCGFTRPVPVNCDGCGSDDILMLGSGTQRIEEIISGVFKEYKIFRLDQDSSRKRSTVYNLLEEMNDDKIDILVGTQLVAKGFDFHNVTLVGVLLADIGLNLPDFRSSEKIFSLLVQVAGRCGRGDSPGKVIVQTINKNNPIFKYIIDQDYYGFYRSELDIRKALGYPPFSRLARLLVRGKSEEKVKETINRLKDELQENINSKALEVQLLGPSSAPFSKIAGNYRHHIILKASDVKDLRTVIKPAKKAVSVKGLYLEVDIDPYDML